MILEKPTLALMDRLGIDAVPPISLESDAAVNELFDYLEPRDSNPRLTGLAYPLLGLIYKPRIFLPRGVGQLITNHMEDGGQVALALDHTYGDDHVKWGGATWNSSLHPMWRNSDIMAKAVLADEHPALSLTLVNLGIISVIRSQDARNPRFGGVENLGDEPSKEVWARHDLATRRAVQVGISRINRRNNHGSHVGGKRRDPNNPAPIIPDGIKTGLFEMILGADDPDNIMLLVGALDKGGRYFRRSIMVLSEPIEHRPTPKEFKEPVATAMQQCRKIAEQISASERPNIVRPLTQPLLNAAKLAWEHARS